MPALRNTRHEQFAQLIASGETGVAAYRKAYGINGQSAESSASRLLRSVKVSARVAELRADFAKRQSKAVESAVKESAAQLTGTLLTMQRRRELLRERAERKDISHTALVAVILADARLAGEITDKQDLTYNGQSLVPVVNFSLQPHWRTGRM